MLRHRGQLICKPVFNNLNAQVGDGAAFKTLSLSTRAPSKEVEKTLMFNPYDVENRHTVMLALERGPIRSAENLAQTINEELRDWQFSIPRRDGTLNSQGLEPMYFCESHETTSVKCVVVPLAPWEFAPQDFQDLTCMATVRRLIYCSSYTLSLNSSIPHQFVDVNESLDGSHNPWPLSNADKMWAYVSLFWNRMRHKSHRISVTSCMTCVSCTAASISSSVATNNGCSALFPPVSNDMNIRREK